MNAEITIMKEGNHLSAKKKYVILSIVISVILIGLAGVCCIACMQMQEGKIKQSKEPVATEASRGNEEKEAVVTPSPSPTMNPHENEVRSTITGTWISKKKAKKRPYAIMINNIRYAFLHQKGTSKADIMYEALAEGGITRMMAIYQDPSKVKVIGSVRSARHYYVQFAKEWNAIYCHFGQTKYATQKIADLGVNNLSGLSGIGPTVYARDASFSAPHNVFTSGKKLQLGAKKSNYSLKQDVKRTAKHFTFYGKDTSLKGTGKVKKIILPFSTYSTCTMKYNAKKKQYEKYEYGQKHMDTYYNKQLSFKNVIIQFVEESAIDRNGYQTMELANATGTGYYITNGKKTSITWMRSEAGNRMVYLGKDGKVLKVNPGKTYIAVYPKNRKNQIQMTK